MYKSVFLFVIILFLTFNAYAQGFYNYFDSKKSYSINYPDKWEVKVGEEGYDVTFSNKLKTAFCGIKSGELEAEVSTVNIIDSLEAELKDIKKITQKTFNKKECENVGITQGIWRLYRSDAINMVLYVFAKEKKVYILTEIINKSESKEESILLKKVSYSFKLKK